MSEIKLYGLIEEDAVNAPGISMSVFCQGCWHPKDTPNMVDGHCVGCHNPESQPFTGGYVYTDAELLEKLKANPLHKTLVLSGGEPMCQAEALLPLCKHAKEAGYSVWMYSGYTLEQLLRMPEWHALYPYVDVLVDGPFIQELKSARLQFRGSKNQRLLNVQKTMPTGVPVLCRKRK